MSATKRVAHLLCKLRRRPEAVGLAVGGRFPYRYFDISCTCMFDLSAALDGAG